LLLRQLFVEVFSSLAVPILSVAYSVYPTIVYHIKNQKMKKCYLLTGLLFFTLLATAQNVFLDDYAPGVSFAGFGGSTNDVTIDNTQAQTGSSSLKIQVTTGYTGGAFVNTAAQNLSAFNCISFWIKASKNATLNVSGLGNNGSANVLQAEYSNFAITTSWSKVIIPIPDPAKFTAETGMFHFAEGSDEGAYTIWLDEIKYETLGTSVIGTPTVGFATETINNFVGDSYSPVGITCSFPVNGTTQNLSIAKAFLTLASSNTSVVTIGSGSICNAVGVGSASVTGKLGATNATGAITFNVSSASSGAPTTAAPAPPARIAADVIGLFTGAYTEVAGTDWFPNWGQSTVVSDEQIAGNTTKKYVSLNYQGAQFASAINASAMSKLHIDVWTPNCTAFEIFLINTAPTTVEQKVTLTPTLSGWNSFDIDLSQYGTINLGAIAQLKFVGTPFGTSTVYWDNLYFYKSAAGTPATAAPTPPARIAADVIGLYSGAYTEVAGTDWNPAWGQSTTVADTTIAGNLTKKYGNLNYQGVQFAAPINASAMTKLHIDIWTPNCTAFEIFLINTSPATVEQKVTVNPTLAGWNSFDIELSQYNTIALNNIGQLKFAGTPFGTSTVYWDNLYFYKPADVVPTTAAPVPPSRSSGDVIGLFTGAYTEVAGTDWFPNWGQSTTVTDTLIAGNAAKKYGTLNYQGVQFAAPIDASAMLKLHMDIWTPNCTAFEVFLINTSPATVEQKVTLTPTLSGWNSFDIDLSQFNLIALNNIGQLKFVGTPFGTSTVYWDNLYFYKGSPLPVTLLSYSAAKNASGGITINWATTAEYNSDYFLVEKSKDGLLFTTLKTVTANNSYAGISNYEVIDESPVIGSNFYRLTQIDRDGRRKVYAIKKVNISRLGQGIFAYPNPVSGNIVNVVMPEANNKIVPVQLMALNGSLVYSATIVQQGNLVQVKLANKPLPGIYMLKVADNNPLKIVIQ
jgi:hypothetical protein